MPKHEHYESMRLYLEDAGETDKPYERWEYSVRGQDKWIPLRWHPTWAEIWEYRRIAQAAPEKVWTYALEDVRGFWFDKLYFIKLGGVTQFSVKDTSITERQAQAIVSVLNVYEPTEGEEDEKVS